MIVLFIAYINHINKSLKPQLNKIHVEFGLLAIRLLRFSGRMLTFFFRVISGFFRLFFKDVFYKILVKIYYNAFRLKKNELTTKALNEINRNQLVYWIIFLMISGFLFLNLMNSAGAKKLDQQISKTILANLIPNGFSDQPIEELITDSSLSSDLLNSRTTKENPNLCSLDKLDELNNKLDDYDTGFSFLDDTGDLAIKPILFGDYDNSEDSNNGIKPRTSTIYYTVENGDTVSSIARRFGISVNTILWANNLGAASFIRPGDRLMILPYSGVLYTVKSGDTLAKIALKYGVEIEKILSCNDLGAHLKIDQKLIIPGAKKIIEQIASRRTTSNTSYNSGLSVIQGLIKPSSIKVPSGSKMVWPTAGHRITQYFSWRHNGIDIGNKVGTPIYAADDGIVEIAAGGWNGGYGNTILLNHGGGKKTRYGHASKLYVRAGEAVEKGQVIALMGSTGRSTGPHLHFEVLVGRSRYNPLNYVR